ncbi:MAG TPA: YbaK/EbsC family protein [Caldithrix abyssi]|uniref:YbaK/EbsC family protein n=1 Tax=Caldithrix abyssi TaxID=187145 RepID=A0A7V5UF50_CALAY|nr:YbaK/EbsC family protein [Caldithrix abyssi]
MPMNRLRNYLDEHGVKYVVIIHSPTYTAQEIAASAHIPGNELAKTVILKIDGKMAMAVLPASRMVDLELCQEKIGAKKVELATEEEFKYQFSDCEIGAMPPFGNLFDMETYVSDELKKNEFIVFNAGNHRELIKTSYRDFEKLVQPKVIPLSN